MPGSTNETRRQAIEVAHATALLSLALSLAVPFTLDGAARIIASLLSYDVARDEGITLATIVVRAGLLLACSIVLASPAALSLAAVRRVEARAAPSKTSAPAPVVMVVVDVGTALGLGAWLASGLPVPTELGKPTPTSTLAASGLLTILYGVLSLSLLVVTATSKPRATWD
jgi:hypothetical protein